MGRAKLLLSRELGETLTRVSGSAGASPSRGWRIPNPNLEGALAESTTRSTVMILSFVADNL